mgnify:CR=1 FL=1
MDNFITIIATNIRKLREERNWSQQELADKMSIARPTVSKWENQQSEPQASQLAALAKIFNVSTEYILGNTDKPSHKILVVDTSIFIKRPIAINEFIKIFDEVIIPDVVISELNNLKDNKRSKVHQKAWLAMANIEKFKTDSKLIIEKTDVSNTDINDKKIAKVAEDRSKVSIRDKVYMYTDDIYFSYLITETTNLEVIGPEKYDSNFGEKDEDFDLIKTQNFFSYVKESNLDKLKQMELIGIDVNRCDPSSGYTPLIQAVRNKNYNVLNYLVNIPYIDLNKKDEQKYNFTPLLHTCQLKDISMMKILIDAGADPNIGSSGVNFGNTPTMVCSWGGFLDGVKFLSEQDICYNQQDNNGFTALHKACIKHNYEIAKILILKTDIKIRDRKNLTAEKHLKKDNYHSKDIIKLFINARNE